jgi:hypothetical protein
MSEIEPSSCSDEDIIQFIENVKGEDSLHYKHNWIIMRALKIIFRVLQTSELHEDMKDKCLKGD